MKLNIDDMSVPELCAAHANLNKDVDSCCRKRGINGEQYKKMKDVRLTVRLRIMRLAAAGNDIALAYVRRRKWDEPTATR